MQPFSESCPTLSPEKGIVETPLPIDWQSNSCIADEMEDNLLDTAYITVSERIINLTVLQCSRTCIYYLFHFFLSLVPIYLFSLCCSFIQPNPELEKLLEDLCPPLQQTSDCKIFSPLHSQMQSELGNPYLYSSFTDDINSNQQNIPLQYGTNTDDINDFLNSVLIDPEEQSFGGVYSTSSPDSPKYINTLTWVQGSNSGSESEGEVSQIQVIRIHIFGFLILACAVELWLTLLSSCYLVCFTPGWTMSFARGIACRKHEARVSFPE